MAIFQMEFMENMSREVNIFTFENQTDNEKNKGNVLYIKGLNLNE